MPFQTDVRPNMAAGVPGELATNYAHKAQTYTINSADAANNIIGSVCCTISDELVCEVGAGGAYGFAGFLVNPKGQALHSMASQPFEASMTVPNGVIVECLTQGVIFVMLEGPANIGDSVVFDNVTGRISAISSVPIFFEGTLTNASDVVTMVNTSGVEVGQSVTGTGIPANTTVLAVTPNTSIQLSANATASGLQDLTFLSPASLPAGKTFANAIVDYLQPHNDADPQLQGAQLAIVAVSPTYTIPQ